MARLILIFVCLALTCERGYALEPSHRLSQYGHSVWKVQDGALPAVPEAMAHGIDGYLWIGTTWGLLRFDGVRFVPWTSAHGEQFASKYITSLLATDDGSLWIGSILGLDRLRDGRLTRISTGPGLVLKIQVGRDGRVWAVQGNPSPIERSLCVVQDDRLQCPAPLPGLDLSANSCCTHGLAQGPDGSLWVGADMALLNWRDGKTDVIRPAALEANRGMGGISAIVATRRGDLWVGMNTPGHEGGLQRVVDGKLQPLLSPELDSSALMIYTLFVDSHDALWVGTGDQGLLRIHGDRVERFRSSDGLSSDTVLRIYEDREGNVWVATTRGLDRFRDLEVVTYTTREGLSSDGVGAVLPRADGSIWIGTIGGLNVLRDGEITTVDAPHRIRNAQITSMLEDAAGRVWIGVEQSMMLYDGSKFTPVADAEGRPPGLVVGLAQDQDRNVWMEAITPHRLMRVAGSKVREQFPAPDIPAARKVAADPAGGIWLGLVSGDLAHFRNGRLDVLSYAEINPTVQDRRVNQLLVQQDGAVLGATEFGLIEAQAGKRRTLTHANGLPCERTFSMLFDAAEDLWLYLECGLVRIRKSELAAWRADPSRRVAVRLFDTLYGSLTSRVPFTPEAARARDGRLWFASANGLQMIDPARADRGDFVPPVHIEAILADRKSYSMGSQLQLPPLTRDIELAYTAPGLALPQKLTFRYRLEGYDEHWQEVGARRQAFYNDLPPGDYRFHVTACTQDGACNAQGATVAFAVLPAFHQTPWFSVIVALAAAALLWALFAWRLRQVAVRLRSRLEASLEERERIARELHDTFLQSVQGLMLKFQSAMEKIPVGEPARHIMEQALERADEVMVEGRTRVTALRRSTQGRHDFTAAIRMLTERVAEDAKGDVRLSVEGEPRMLHPVVGEEAQRILTEALNNTLRHANARNIHIGIIYSRREFVVRLVDDGRGFDVEVLKVAAADGHWGLAGMRERARKIQAQLEIASKPDAGTSIELRVRASIAYATERRERRSAH
ncbi:hypothetical protein JM946_00800 [Steroidobacter sp. S1-65]|uniref:Histidine kinase/HSP90-like ATPase domain-containing protein n=1 Tax=Steroidobacter gossypii TaxID=2805490 RepID=A0ABS1WQK0_9GAMM|nr:sensor histidine kinase [Steroidobacter gossypii]MBM0103255.1 hypothetical protein [Steroidobacter gossypii]